VRFFVDLNSMTYAHWFFLLTGPPSCLFGVLRLFGNPMSTTIRRRKVPPLRSSSFPVQVVFLANGGLFFLFFPRLSSRLIYFFASFC